VCRCLVALSGPAGLVVDTWDWEHPGLVVGLSTESLKPKIMTEACDGGSVKILLVTLLARFDDG